jgi:hypothetical protein
VKSYSWWFLNYIEVKLISVIPRRGTITLLYIRVKKGVVWQIYSSLGYGSVKLSVKNSNWLSFTFGTVRHIDVIVSHLLFSPLKRTKCRVQLIRNWKANLFTGQGVVSSSISTFLDVRLGTNDVILKLFRMYLNSNLQCDYWPYMTTLTMCC